MMSDVEEIIDFIRQLKKGFDKELFQSKIDELAYIAETSGLPTEYFNILFKIWLNLSIPINKWMSLGACLVPQDTAEQRIIDYAFCWLLANCEQEANYSRMAFLLDWLTAGMDCDAIDMTTLDSGYEIFYSLLISNEVLTVNALKLVYTLSKPSDVTRKKVLNLIDLAKIREGRKNKYRQIQVLLGLFKSYRPECVPEDVPAISVHTSFRKINANLLTRFKIRQQRRNGRIRDRNNLMWINPLNADGGRIKKPYPLVPNMEFTNIGSKLDAIKDHLDFTDPICLLQSRLCATWRPAARQRALLANRGGLALLALAARDAQAFLAHDLHHLLATSFLDSSPHSYAEKADFLRRLGELQRTLLQGIPVITRFLTQYLPFWNEQDYFNEILGLVEWVSADSPEQVSFVVKPLMRIYYRAHPMEQCALLKALTTMYCNLVHSSTRTRQHFMSTVPQGNYALVLPQVASSIAEMCQKGLQINPEDMRVVQSSLWWAGARARAERRAGAALGAAPRALLLALPLLLPAAAPWDAVAALLILYRNIFIQMKAANKHKDQSYLVHRKALKDYTNDFFSCLYHEQTLSERKSGLIFKNVNPQLVEKLTKLAPEVDSCYSIRNNLAFAMYTFKHLDANNSIDAGNMFCSENFVRDTFPNLSEFLMIAVPELQ